MKDKFSDYTDNEIIELIKAAKPNGVIPQNADFRIKQMIRTNTKEYVLSDSGKILFFQVRKFAQYAAAAVIVMAAGLFVWYNNYMDNKSANYVLTWGVANEIEGNVEVINTENGMLLQKGGAVTEKSVIVTSNESNCVFTLNEGSRIMLGQNTRLKIEKFQRGAKNEIVLNLESGAVAAWVSKLSKDSIFEIHSKTLNATVRGTEFMVSEIPGQEPYVAVLNGKVQVTNNIGKKENVLIIDSEMAYLSNNNLKIEKIKEDDSSFVSKLKVRGNGFIASTKQISPEITGENISTAQSIDANGEGEKAVSAKSNGIVRKDLSNDEYEITKFQFKVLANKEWVNTNIKVRSGDIVTISANGEVATMPNGRLVGPNGEETDNKDDSVLCKTAPYGALIMTPDRGSNLIYVGISDKYRASSDGELKFTVNDKSGCYKDNLGFFGVSVTVKHRK